MVEVTQADRDAAFAVLVHTDDNNGYGREYIRDGLYDGNMVIQTLAAYRLAAIAEGRRQMREEAAGVAGEGNEHWRSKSGVTKDRRESRDYETMAIACAHVQAAIRAIPIGDE